MVTVAAVAVPAGIQSPKILHLLPRSRSLLVRQAAQVWPEATRISMRQVWQRVPLRVRQFVWAQKAAARERVRTVVQAAHSQVAWERQN